MEGTIMTFFNHATDPKLEKEGIKLPFEGFSFTVARAGGNNRKFRSVLAAKLKPHAHKIQQEKMTDAQMEKVMAEVYAETVLIGWDGVTDEEGNALPYNKRNAVKFLTDPRFIDLVELIRQVADNAASFRLAQEEEDREVLEKNSDLPSSGAAKKAS